MDEELISRGDVSALLSNVADIGRCLERIEHLLADGDGEAEADEG